MPIHIDAHGQLHHDQAHNFALACPHCQVLSHLTPVSVPDYAQLVRFKPSHVGLVYRCDACNGPVFLKYAVKIYAANRVELASGFQELERAKEKFNFTYLPEDAEALFREALDCFGAGCFNAFASMCRRTAQAVFVDLGDNGKLRMFDQLNDVREMAELDQETFNLIRKVLFGSDGEPRPNMPALDAYSAGVLLEAIKDLLYQAYVRRGRLQQAMTVRRYFADDADGKVTPLAAAQFATGGGVPPKGRGGA
ncbi:MAG: hypothetical protein O9284_13435 [Steroidobacteraceae bacterium]|jgi:hypothetical protein|nr:hypothetical protein [Steroidobacteraceae bacterium]